MSQHTTGVGALGAVLVGLVAAGPFVMGGAPAIPRPAQRSKAKPVTTVQVTAREFSFKLSRTALPVRTTRFIVTNAGTVTHDFVIAGRKTRILAHGQRASLLLPFRKAGRYPYRCSVAGHAALGMKGVLVVGNPKPAPPPPPPPPVPPNGVKLTKVATFDQPVLATSPPGDEHRLFVVELSGVIRELVDGVPLDRPFLDITRYVSSASETGLLGLAFAPDYATSGRFYVYFNDHVANGNVNVVEFRRSTVDPDVADPNTYRQVLTIEKPWENHNAGMMEFGPDGYLYVAVGDGDSGVLHRPGAFAQTLDDLLGNILRIDPSQQPDGAPYGVPADNPFVGVADARPEIWAFGLRNPWRFDIDRRTGDLYLGDVGEGTEEEIDIIPGGHGGENFGWPCFEGSVAFDATASCPNSVPPVVAFFHGKDCSVIGGVVVRDPRLPQLAGRFLYGDLCSGNIRSLLYQGGKVVSDEPTGATLPQTTSFGEDGLGRIYVMSLEPPALYRLDPAP